MAVSKPKRKRPVRPIDEVQADVDAQWAKVDEILAELNVKAKSVNEFLDGPALVDPVENESSEENL